MGKETKESKYKSGDMVILLDVPEIRKKNESFTYDVGFNDGLLCSIGHIFSIQAVHHMDGRFVYLLLLSYGTGNIPWRVEEDWIDPAGDYNVKLDAFLDEWRCV